MCLILLAYQSHPRYPLILAANRDEYHDRPTRPACFWPEAPRLLGGCDLVGGGTWLGITRSGRFAALTNYREPVRPAADAPSRGLLVRNYLLGEDAPRHYLARTTPSLSRYGGLNLLLGDPERLYYTSNRGVDPAALSPGVHGLSNHLMDTPWPKVREGKHALQAWLQAEEPRLDDLFDLLADRHIVSDACLPDTGVGLHAERALSARFIDFGDYGTRCSSVLLVGDDARLTFAEREFSAGGARGDTRVFSFALDPGWRS